MMEGNLSAISKQLFAISDDESKFNRHLMKLHAAIATNHKSQPDTLELLKFLCDLPKLQKAIPSSKLFNELTD